MQSKDPGNVFMYVRQFRRRGRSRGSQKSKVYLKSLVSKGSLAKDLCGRTLTRTFRSAT
jgi:hypothetical protein